MTTSLLVRVLVLSVGTLAIGSQACTLASPTNIKMEPAAGDDDDSAASSSSAATTSGTPAASTCSAKFTKPDASTLTSCGTAAHCFEKDKMDGAVSSLFAAGSCTDANSVCVPDEVLNANGAKLASCTVSILSKPGGCIQIDLLPEMKAQGSGSLKQDGCADPSMVCAPCQDPIHGNADTPFCQPIGVRDGVCAAGTAGATTTTAPPAEVGCCTTGGVSNGTCLAQSGVPASMQSSVSADSCTGGNMCVPKAMVDGTPKTCNGGTILGKGVCLDKCFSSMMSTAGSIGFLDQDVCGATELCVPCSVINLESDVPVPGCQ